MKRQYTLFGLIFIIFIGSAISQGISNRSDAQDEYDAINIEIIKPEITKMEYFNPVNIIKNNKHYNKICYNVTYSYDGESKKKLNDCIEIEERYTVEEIEKIIYSYINFEFEYIAPYIETKPRVEYIPEGSLGVTTTTTTTTQPKATTTTTTLPPMNIS